MSEEKDKKKPTISDLEKLLENEPNDKVYIKPDGTIDVVNLTEQIKFLESRLRQAGYELEYCHALWQQEVRQLKQVHEEDRAWWANNMKDKVAGRVGS
jgi:hypothetical protein